MIAYIIAVIITFICLCNTYMHDESNKDNGSTMDCMSAMLFFILSLLCPIGFILFIGISVFKK